MITLTITNQKQFNAALDRAIKKANDLTVPLKWISLDWFDTNKPIFNTGRRGGWPDLAASTKKQKRAKYGFIYPILEATGRLKSSITIPGSPDAILSIQDKKSLKLGTSVPYGIFHQKGGKIPQRTFVFIGEGRGTPDIAKNIGDKRIKKWSAWLKEYVVSKTKEDVGRG